MFGRARRAGDLLGARRSPRCCRLVLVARATALPLALALFLPRATRSPWTSTSRKAVQEALRLDRPRVSCRTTGLAARPRTALRGWASSRVAGGVSTRRPGNAPPGVRASLYNLAASLRGARPPMPSTSTSRQAADEGIDALEVSLRAQPAPRRAGPRYRMRRWSTSRRAGKRRRRRRRKRSAASRWWYSQRATAVRGPGRGDGSSP